MSVSDEFFALFRGVLEAAPDATLVVDMNGRIAFANAASEKLLLWKAHDLIGQDVERLLPEDRRESHRVFCASYNRAPVLRDMGAGRELVAVRADGKQVPVEIGLSPLPADNEMRIVCVIRDVSDRKRMERDLRTLNEQLEQRVLDRTSQLQSANRELEMLAYSLAHDLRAPLRAVNGFAARLREQLQATIDAEGARCLDVITSRASHMGSMIDDYLRLMSVGRRELALENLNMRELLSTAWQEVRSPQHEEQLSIELHADSAVLADRTLLLEVCKQLLGNAVKFTAQIAEPKIRVTVRTDERYVYFIVSDNGVGFDPAHAGKLFRVFERLHVSPQYPGNGIGLCLVRRILDRHEGSVSIEGAVNGGAKVTFWLPMGN